MIKDDDQKDQPGEIYLGINDDGARSCLNLPTGFEPGCREFESLWADHLQRPAANQLFPSASYSTICLVLFRNPHFFWGDILVLFGNVDQVINTFTYHIFSILD